MFSQACVWSTYGGYLHPSNDGGRGDYIYPADQGVPPSGQQGVGYSHPANGGTASFLMGVPPFFPIGGYTLVKTGWGTALSILAGNTPPSPSRLDGGTHPLAGLDGVPSSCQETEQQSERFLRGGRYASCVHAGGLSCYWLFLSIEQASATRTAQNHDNIWYKRVHSSFSLIVIWQIFRFLFSTVVTTKIVIVNISTIAPYFSEYKLKVCDMCSHQKDSTWCHLPLNSR